MKDLCQGTVLAGRVNTTEGLIMKSYVNLKKIAKLSDEAQQWISDKIAFLIKEEGLTQEQAQGKAYGMARQKFPSVPEKGE